MRKPQNGRWQSYVLGLIWWWCCSQTTQLHIGNFDFGFWVQHKRKYIIHRDFVLARSWSYDKTDEARLLVEHSNMLSLGWNVVTRAAASSRWHVNLGSAYLNVPLATVHHLHNVLHYANDAYRTYSNSPRPPNPCWPSDGERYKEHYQNQHY